jgi:hypothetical protein
MNEKNEAYLELNKKWKGICKALLGDEIGELSEYEKWLYSGNGPRKVRKSSVSGKDVTFANQPYREGSKWMGLEEVDFEKKYAPLKINNIKDIDSLLQAVGERVYYTGNMVLGNSKFVEKSAAVTDCFYVYSSERVAFAKYVAYSTRGGYSENVFGCYGFGPVQFAVKSSGITEVSRVFGVSKADYSSDCYYSHGLSACHDCMFSFNLKGKRQAIGNLQLPPDKYLQLKAKLIGELREKLRKDKRLPSIVEFFAGAKPDYSELKRAALQMGKYADEKLDRKPIEDAFSKAANVLLGKRLSGIDNYGHFLAKNSSVKMDDGNSCLSGKPMKLTYFAGFQTYPALRLLTQQEADFAGERLVLNETEIAALSLQNASTALSKIAYFCPFWLTGTLKNNIETPLNLEAVDCYKGALYIKSKLCAYCFCPRSCDYTFGSNEGRHLSFCINCHYSVRLTRCVECDSCASCSDAYFCHNCENVHDSMFCFNVKNLRYAIGNVEVGREKYLEIKKMLLDEIGKKIAASGDFPLDIYNIGAAKRGK